MAIPKKKTIKRPHDWRMRAKAEKHQTVESITDARRSGSTYKVDFVDGQWCVLLVNFHPLSGEYVQAKVSTHPNEGLAEDAARKLIMPKADMDPRVAEIIGTRQ